MSEPTRKPSTWGGKREGAGPPTLPGGPMVKIAVTLRPSDLAYLKELGGGVSAGIRRLVDQACR